MLADFDLTALHAALDDERRAQPHLGGRVARQTGGVVHALA
jgi:hypothetical protein